MWFVMVLLTTQTALSRKTKSLVKDRIPYLGGKTIHDTHCPEAYKMKVTGCVWMILVQLQPQRITRGHLGCL